MDTTPREISVSDVPLVLDVDGTLLRTDLLYESFWAALGSDFKSTLRALATRWKHPELLKGALTGIDRPSIDLLPVRDSVYDMAQRAIEQGRSVHLVSGSHQSLVDDLAGRLALPGPHFGSDSERNLTDATKAAFLKEHFGTGCYDYVGNAEPDLKSWEGARKIVAVEPGAALAQKIAAMQKPTEIISDGWGVSDVLREIRPHQWLKNLLLFVPLLASHTFDLAAFLAVCLSTAAFSLGASSIYILNDLLDLEADRSHPEKRYRPIASGRLPISVSMRLSLLLAILALLLGLAVNPSVALMTLAYMAGSLSYSLWLKKRRWLDLLALTGLFLLRILTGALAAGTGVTAQLLMFAFVFFFTLACVKRLTALSRMPTRRHLPGRGYSSNDLVPLEYAAYTSVALSGCAFLIYVGNAHAAGLYSAPLLAALAAVPSTLWLFRMVRLSIAGQEDYDPVRFVLHDRFGLTLMVAGAGLLILAI